MTASCALLRIRIRVSNLAFQMTIKFLFPRDKSGKRPYRDSTPRARNHSLCKDIYYNRLNLSRGSKPTDANVTVSIVRRL